LPRDGSWLAKPILGSGGQRVHVFDERSPLATPSEPNAHRRPARWYFQRRQAGVSASAVFVAAAGTAVLLGVTKQLVGEPWCGGGPFQYAGSIGPLEIDGQPLRDTARSDIVAVGSMLAAEFQLVGLFGVDGIVCDGRFWPVEVNPRYTASCEVVERLTLVNTVAVHAAACADSALREPEITMSPNRAAGKAIVFAAQECIFGEPAAEWVRARNAMEALPCAADIPRAGTRFSAGDPIATVLTEGDNAQHVRNRLQRLVDELRHKLA
jgi:predicted ATP-grasp superfamily ATP-dependent carboligase